MDLGLQGQTVTRVDADHTVSLETDGGYEVRVEVDLSLSSAAGEVGISPGQATETNPLAQLQQQRIAAAIADPSGALSIIFDNGATLRVNPHRTYEAWTLAGPAGYKVVCMPGGELAVWSPEQDNQPLDESSHE